MPEGPISRIRFGDSFVDAAGCREWLSTLTVTNVSLATEGLLGQMERLRLAPLRPLERMRIAEILREPLAFLQGELVRRYGGKSVPHDAREREAADSSLQLWQRLLAQYSVAVKALLEGDRDLKATVERVLERALYAAKQLVLIHGLARRQLSSSFWSELHSFYRLAEIFGCTATTVSDPGLPAAQPTSCEQMYAHALLLALADPYALTVRELELVDRWLGRWARKVTPFETAPEGDGALLAVDLERPGGFAVIAALPAARGSGVRLARTVKLSQSVGGRVKRLMEGATPAELQLGEDCVADASMQLLKHLFSRWCLVRKRHPPAAVEGTVELCGGGLEALFFRTAGRTVPRTDTRNRLTFRAAEEIAVRAAISDYDPGRERAERAWPWEVWQGVVSAADARLARVDEPRHRWQLDQIVICREGAETRLGRVAWIAESHAPGAPPSLSIEIRLWPGKVEPALLRTKDKVARADSAFPGFFLHGGGEALATLVVPPRVFAAERRLETAEGELRSITMLHSIERGADFERLAFEGT